MIVAIGTRLAIDFDYSGSVPAKIGRIDIAKRDGMMTKPLSRRETRQALRDLPMESILRVGKTELTAKQKKFAQAVAMGNTGADAYRQAYETSGTNDTIGNNASRLKADSRIKAEIEAYRLANEAAAYRTASQLRDLVIHSLTQVLIDPETKHAQKIQAAKVIGQITEVNLFTERKEITHVNGSDEIKARIMAELNTLMLGSGSTDIEDVDAISLLEEIAGSNEDLPYESADSAIDEGYSTGSPPNGFQDSVLDLHSTPDKDSPSETTPMV